MAMRSARIAAAVLTAGLLLGAGTGVAAADDGGGGGEAAGPTEAGTTFRTAAGLTPGQTATAVASTGDYLYWSFPAGAGSTATVTAEVDLPDADARHGSSRWRLDVYDGLRRRQPCTAGTPTATAGADTGTVTLDCTLPTVRAWAEPWSDAPLPGAYYVRLTTVSVPDKDIGLPVRTEVRAELTDADGSTAVDGDLGAPLLPVVEPGQTGEPDPAASSSATPSPSPSEGVSAAPETGWASWWSDRWLWTVAGGVLGALAAVGGYTLTRRPRR
jgi:hypothetical protein